MLWGREVKKVSLDFEWFRLDGNTKVWEGYILNEIKCFLCKGKGKNSKKKECPLCYGEGSVSPIIEPPFKGNDNMNGYQIWEDVSEGSPVSPVFRKAEDLAQWMVENDNSIMGSTSYETWLKMIKEEGSCPSGIIREGKFKPGTSVYEEEEGD